ncbi:MAG: hypothetical protein WKG07_09690 [Hymenobacter sp.]
MREAAFLRQNQARWQQYEARPATNPDELAARFVALTDDLAYAQTFYPASPTTAYLNTLAGQLHQSLYRNKAEAAAPPGPLLGRGGAAGGGPAPGGAGLGDGSVRAVHGAGRALGGV